MRIILVLLFSLIHIYSFAQNQFKVVYTENGDGIKLLTNVQDKYNMNWISDSNSYRMKKWEINEYRSRTGKQDNGGLTKSWGEGYCTMVSHGNKELLYWKIPKSFHLQDNRFHAVYEFKDIYLLVDRYLTQVGEFKEHYTFVNRSKEVVQLRDIHIYTPLADNYPNALASITNRCHAHIWAGGNGGYLNAVRMGGEVPHLGMALKQGSLDGYSYEEKWSSNTRGTLSLHFQDITLKPQQKGGIEWVLFWHKGWNDFFNHLKNQYGYVIGAAAKYTIEKGETAYINFSSKERIKALQCFVNNFPIPFRQEKNTIFISYKPLETGEYDFQLKWNGNKETSVKILVTISTDKLIKERVDFIILHQQLNDPLSEKNGAYLVYDNEKKEIYLNEDTNKRDDTNEGAERLGMGVLIARYLKIDTSAIYKNSAIRYYDFVRHKLQTADYKVFSTIDHKSRHRAYNYPWVADFYLEMYTATSQKQYLLDYYYTMIKFFDSFGYDFYAIGIPLKEGIENLSKAGLTEKRDSLLSRFKRKGDKMLLSGIHYPPHEVNYEQSIVGPSVVYLCELYQVTGDKKYMEEAKKHLILLEAFNGFQPDYHLFEIAIRHWDGFWFGKKRFWGDTFPHYWSTISAVAFWRYYQVSGDEKYLRKANLVLENNLCLFTPHGEAHCAYLYPETVNNQKGKIFDPYANDQDWTLVYYLMIKGKMY